MKTALKLHHIGIATESIEDIKPYLNQFFSIKSISKTIFDPKQNAYLAMAVCEDGQQIELIEGEQVARLVKKQQYLYHLCYETEDIDRTIQEFLEQEAYLVSEPKEAILFSNRRVAFLSTKLGLIELVEKGKGQERK